jgi:hypothetical protein
MRIIDLTEQYLTKFINDGDRREYENSFPELFRHYYRYWVDPNSKITIIGAEEIEKRKLWITQFIEKLSGIFERYEIDDSFIDYLLFIGVGTTNGHVFQYKNNWLVWLPLETYSSKKLVEVFVTHEVAHALHYYNSPSFYCDSKDEMLRVSRQLITEGLATYLTREFLGNSNLEALWADFLPDDDATRWWEKCIEEESNLYNLISQNFYANDNKLKIFYASNPENIYQFRSGYFAGMRLIERFAQKNDLNPKDLLTIPRDKFEKDVANLLKSD